MKEGDNDNICKVFADLTGVLEDGSVRVPFGG